MEALGEANAIGFELGVLARILFDSVLDDFISLHGARRPVDIQL